MTEEPLELDSDLDDLSTDEVTLAGTESVDIQDDLVGLMEQGFEIDVSGLDLDLTESVAMREEATIDQAIRHTDWSETDILDIVTYRPTLNDMGLARSEMSDMLPEHEVHRYTGEAPPLSEYADGERKYDIRRITKPLLHRLAEQHPEVRHLVERDEARSESE